MKKLITLLLLALILSSGCIQPEKKVEQAKTEPIIFQDKDTGLSFRYNSDLALNQKQDGIYLTPKDGTDTTIVIQIVPNVAEGLTLEQLADYTIQVLEQEGITIDENNPILVNELPAIEIKGSMTYKGEEYYTEQTIILTDNTGLTLTATSKKTDKEKMHMQYMLIKNTLQIS